MKAGANQSQQRRHGEIGVEWVCEMGLAWWHVTAWATVTSSHLAFWRLHSWPGQRQSLSQFLASHSLCLASCLLALRFFFFPFVFHFPFGDYTLRTAGAG